VKVGLRLVDEAAAEAIVAGQCPAGYRCAPDFPAEGDRIAARLFLERVAAGADPRPYGAFLVCLEEDSRAPDPAPDLRDLLIGGIGFHGGVDERGRVEIGYAIVPSHQGAGYAKAALGLLIELATELGAQVLTAETEPGNLASQAVLRHLGFTSGQASVDSGDTLFYERAIWPGACRDIRVTR
jgi:RimJ/RimL family protein N-acetyltransferase